MEFMYVMWGSFVLIAVFSIIFGTRHEIKKQELKLRMQMNDFQEKDLAKDLEGVKARLAVLEKIITDKNYDLREELDKLHK